MKSLKQYKLALIDKGLTNKPKLLIWPKNLTQVIVVHFTSTNSLYLIKFEQKLTQVESYALICHG